RSLLPTHAHPFPTRLSSDLAELLVETVQIVDADQQQITAAVMLCWRQQDRQALVQQAPVGQPGQLVAEGLLMEPLTARRLLGEEDRKSTRLNSSHVKISYAV